MLPKFPGKARQDSRAPPYSTSSHHYKHAASGNPILNICSPFFRKIDNTVHTSGASVLFPFTYRQSNFLVPFQDTGGRAGEVVMKKFKTKRGKKPVNDFNESADKHIPLTRQLTKTGKNIYGETDGSLIEYYISKGTPVPPKTKTRHGKLKNNI